jgi:hypothetical protein
MFTVQNNGFHYSFLILYILIYNLYYNFHCDALYGLRVLDIS